MDLKIFLDIKIIMDTQNNTAYESLHRTALQAPSASGVYLWRNPNGIVIYVGKAKNLKNRLSSYFSGDRNVKTKLLVCAAASIEYTTTANEYEAFLLENNLIKKYSPKYNIQLKDGKSYPALKITKEPFPRVIKVRNAKKDGSLLFGPFPDASALETFIESLRSLYPLRRCRTFKKRAAPCMYYHIGRCKAPCCGKIDEQTYNEFIEEIKVLLEGKGEESKTRLLNEMKNAAKDLNFEKAARIRDALKALSIMQNQNIVEEFDEGSRDYIAFKSEGELVSFTVLKMRGGKLILRDSFQATTLSDEDDLLSEFAPLFYKNNEEMPPEIFVEKDAGGLFSRFIKEKSNGLSRVIEAEGANIEKKHRAALDMAAHNAFEDIRRRIRERGDIPALLELQTMLSLPTLPHRIEGFDIAHIGGKFPVASLISFWDGNPDKKNYKYFRLKTTDGVIDDFASMKEATARRYTRLLNEKKPLPDLILIDGGIGQVNAVKEILDALCLKIAVAGLAKRDEEIWLPNAKKPICLPKRSDALRLLQRVRDETHRFATSKNQILRTKENTQNPFLDLPNVGKERATILLQKFDSIQNLSKASEAEIASILHIRANIASEILLAAQTKNSEAKQRIKEKKERIDLELGNETKKSADYAGVLAKTIEESSLKIAEKKE